MNSVISGALSAALSAGASSLKSALPDEQRLRGKIDEAAQSFEASFLSTMMKSMFDGVSAGQFGGGDGEEAFKSFLMDAFAKQTAKTANLGLSDQVRAEMLKLQGLEPFTKPDAAKTGAA